MTVIDIEILKFLISDYKPVLIIVIKNDFFLYIKNQEVPVWQGSSRAP